MVDSFRANKIKNPGSQIFPIAHRDTHDKRDGGIKTGRLRHMVGSSSLASLQSGSPSHFHESSMHRPFERHLNSMFGHGRSHFFSSEPSPQSSTPSQMVADGVQFRLSHWNAPPRQYLEGHWLGISSVPSAQSLSPSHLRKEKQKSRF